MEQTIFNPEEIVNLIISSVFFLYLLFYTKTEKSWIRQLSFSGILLFLFSKFFTVGENVFSYEVFNMLEHIFLAGGSFLIMLSVLRKEV